MDGIESSELIVSQEFDFPSLYVARDKSVGRRMDFLRQEYEVSCRDLLLQAAGIYLDIVHLGRIKESLVMQRDNSVKTLELFTKRLDAGDVTAIDLNRIKIQVMDLERDIMANNAERTELMSALSSLNGYEEPQIDFDCYPAWTYTTSTPSADNDAEVKAAALEVESCKAMESVAKQAWVPKLTLGYRRNTALDEASHGLIVGASFPLFSASSKVKTAKARKAAAEIEAEEIRKRVDNDYAAALKGLEFIRQSMEIYDLNLLDETERLLEKSLEAGAINITDYYAELATVNEKRIGYIDLEYEYYKKLCVLYRNDIKNNSR